MPTENIVFKVLFDTSDATKQVQSLDGVMENATKQVDEFTKNVKGGADGLNNLAKAKKTFTDISMVESTNEVKQLASEIGNATSKQMDFGKAGKQVVEDYKKGKIDQVQATKQLSDSIDKGVVATQKMSAETVKVAGGIKSYRAQIAELKQILPTLEGAEYTKAQSKLAQLTDAMGDQQAQIKLLASDTRGLDTAMQGLQLGVGIFAGLQGASALFGAENEDVQKALLKVNGAMAVLQSLQQIQNTLDKESGFVNSVKLYWKQLFVKETVKETVALEANAVATEVNAVVQTESTLATKAASIWQAIYTFAIEASSSALRIFKFVLASTGIGIAIIGLGLLIANFDKVKKAVMENSEGFQTFKKVLLFISPPIYLIIVAFEAIMRNIDKIKNSLAGFGEAVMQTFSNVGSAITKLTDGDFSGFYDDIKNVGKGVSDAYTAGYVNQEKKNQIERKASRLEFLNTLYDEETKLLESQGKDVSARESMTLSRQLQAKLILLSDADKKELQMVNDKKKIASTLNEKELQQLQEGMKKYKDILDIEFQMDIKFNENQKKANDKALQDREDAKKKSDEREAKRIKDFEDKKKKNAQDAIEQEAKDTIEAAIRRSQIVLKPIEMIATVDFTDKTGEELQKKFDKMKEQMHKAFGELGNGDLNKIFQGFGDSIAAIFDKSLKTNQQKAEAVMKGLQSVSQGISGLIANQIDRNIANFDKLIDAQKSAVEKARNLADKGNSQLLDAEEKKLMKLEQLRRAESKKKKALAIAEAIVNTAVAVTEAMGAPIIGPILAALAGAMGAIQIGIISSQQFAKGGFTGDGTGKRDNTGHIPVGIVHDNEFVLDKEYTTKNRNELEYIHKNRIPLSEILKNNQVPIMAFNNTLSNLQVNNSGQLEERMKAVENAIIDLPNRMPRTSFNADSRGLSMKVMEIASSEKNWRR